MGKHCTAMNFDLSALDKLAAKPSSAKRPRFAPTATARQVRSVWGKRDVVGYCWAFSPPAPALKQSLWLQKKPAAAPIENDVKEKEAPAGASAAIACMHSSVSTRCEVLWDVQTCAAPRTVQPHRQRQHLRHPMLPSRMRPRRRRPAPRMQSLQQGQNNPRAALAEGK